MEYRRLINRMSLLEKQKQAKPKTAKTSDTSDNLSNKVHDISVTIINDQQNNATNQNKNISQLVTKPTSLVKKVLVKNVSMKAMKNVTTEKALVSAKVLGESENTLPSTLINKIDKEKSDLSNDKIVNNVKLSTTKLNNNNIPDITKMCETEKNNLLQKSESEYATHR